MTASTGVNLGLESGYDPGVNGWGAALNRSLRAIDALVLGMTRVVPQTAPPGSPTKGDTYIIAASGASGAWIGHENKVAFWVELENLSFAWQFHAPRDGWQILRVPSDTAVAMTVYTFRNGAWGLPVVPVVPAFVSPEDFGAVGDGVADDRAAWNSAIAAVKAAGGGGLICRSEQYALSVGVNTVDFSNFTLIGNRARLRLLGGATTTNMLSFAGAAGTSTTISTNAAVGDSVINVVDGSAFSVGDWLYISRTTAIGTYHHVLMTRLKSKATNALTLVDPLPDGMLASDSPSVIRAIPLENINVEDVVFEGQNNTGPSRAIFTSYVVNSTFKGLAGKNFSQAAAFWLDRGRGNEFRNISAHRSGSATESDITIRAQTAHRGGGLLSEHATGFGVQFMFSSYGQMSDIYSSGANGRGIKFQGCAWSHFKNLVGNNSASTGVAITVRTIRCTFDGVVALSNRGGSVSNDIGLWFSDQNNDFNRVTNLFARNNQTADIAAFPTDTLNVIEGEWATENVTTGASIHLRNSHANAKIHTPAVTSTAGALTAVTGTTRYQQTGKIVHFQMRIQIITNGSGAGSINATLPITPGYAGVAVARDETSALSCNALIRADSAGITIWRYDSAYPGADGKILRIAGSYEID